MGPYGDIRFLAITTPTESKISRSGALLTARGISAKYLRHPVQPWGLNGDKPVVGDFEAMANQI
jgi:hypothetical protein